MSELTRFSVWEYIKTEEMFDEFMKAFDEEHAATITRLEARVRQLEEALRAELADHEEAITHDGGGLKYASLVGISVSNADSLAQSVRYHEKRAGLIRAALNPSQEKAA